MVCSIPGSNGVYGGQVVGRESMEDIPLMRLGIRRVFWI